MTEQMDSEMGDPCQGHSRDEDPTEKVDYDEGYPKKGLILVLYYYIRRIVQ